jgi:hypothetical protein
MQQSTRSFPFTQSKQFALSAFYFCMHPMETHALAATEPISIQYINLAWTHATHALHAFRYTY